MLKSVVKDLKDRTSRVSDTLSAKLSSPASLLGSVKDHLNANAHMPMNMHKHMDFRHNLSISSDAVRQVKANLKTYSDRMATIIDHVRRGYDRDESTDIPESLFSDDEEEAEDGNGNLGGLRRNDNSRPGFCLSNAEDDDDFLKRLKWPKLSDKQVDAVLGRLDGGKESEKNGNDTRNFLKIIEIPGDLNADSKNGTKDRMAESMNNSLQICFMNEMASDSDEEMPQPRSLPSRTTENVKQEDFWRKQARLQAEARVALAQACHMSKIQMELERLRKKNALISELISLPQSCYGHRRLSRSLLTKLTTGELDSIHTSLVMEVKRLNEELVTNLLLRDELHMEQDSMLVDLEDLTRHINAKGEGFATRGPQIYESSAKQPGKAENGSFSLTNLVKNVKF